MPFITGSRAADLALLALLAALVLLLAPRVRVYYEVPGWAKERSTTDTKER
ncbi:MAG: hypothetical protein ACQGVC_07245 [Myxococcota bacterium]